MMDRIHIGLGAEHAVGGPHPGRQGEHCLAGGVEAVLLVIGHHERLGRLGRQSEAVLDGGHAVEVVRIVRVDEHARCDEDVGRLVAVDTEFVHAGIVKDLVDVVILVDDHHRHVPITVLRHRERRAVTDVHDGEAVERVPVHADHGLVIDRCRGAMVRPGVHRFRIGVQTGEHPVRLSPHEVVDIHTLCHPMTFAHTATPYRRAVMHYRMTALGSRPDLRPGAGVRGQLQIGCSVRDGGL